MLEIRGLGAERKGGSGWDTTFAIDPGVSGAVAFCRGTMLKEADVVLLSQFDAKMAASCERVLIEDVASFHTGVSLKLTESVGFWTGYFTALGATCTKVRPQVWQKKLFPVSSGRVYRVTYDDLGGEEEKKAKEAIRIQKRKENKASALEVAKENFPHLLYKLTPERGVRTAKDVENLADALCLLLYFVSILETPKHERN